MNYRSRLAQRRIDDQMSLSDNLVDLHLRKIKDVLLSNWRIEEKKPKTLLEMVVDGLERVNKKPRGF